MKVLLLCGNHPRHLFIAKKLYENGFLCGLVIEKRAEFIAKPPQDIDDELKEIFITHFNDRAQCEYKYFGRISENDFNVSKKFITCYFLGPVNEKYQNEIRTLAEKNCCDIVDLTNIESDYYCCGPSEFVWLIKNAFCICTDSFHASAFSILYNKPFIAFDREGKYNRMGSRIETLLRTFHLTCAILDMDLTFNYNEPNQILEKERRKVDHFLQNALH